MTNPRDILTILSLAVLPLIAACGSSTSTGSDVSPSAGTADTSPTPSGAASSGTALTPLVKSATVTIAGAPMNVLTNDTGFTLYYRTSDTATTVTCTGTCATNWPPVLQVAGRSNAAPPLDSSISVLDGPNGKQLVYKGHPLYRFATDKAPGDAKGHNAGPGVWFAMTV